jgi:hypothetical protein
MLLSPFCLNWTWPHLTGNSDETKNTANEGRTEIVKGLKGSFYIDKGWFCLVTMMG